MPLGKTPILQSDLMAEGDSNKHLLFNDALLKLEDSANRQASVDLTAGDVTLTEGEILRYGVVMFYGNTTPRTVTIPKTVGAGIDTNRILIVRNTGTDLVNITHEDGAGNAEVLIDVQGAGIVYCNGTDIVSLGGIAGSGARSVSHDAVTVVADATDIDFTGSGVDVTNDADGTVTVTIEYTGAQIKALYEAEVDTNNYSDGEKAKLAGLESSKYLGTYVDLPALEAAHAAPVVGSYAHVDAGVGEDVEVYVWDADDSIYVLMGSGGAETSATIKSKYEANPDTNAFTDAEKTKLFDTQVYTSAEKSKLAGLGGSGAVAVSEDGVERVSAASNLNFTGTGVSVTDTGAGSVEIEITGGGGGPTTLVGDAYEWEEVPITNGDFETGDMTGWTVDVGTATVLPTSGTYAAVVDASNGGFLVGGGNQGEFEFHQDKSIVAVPGMLFTVTADLMKDYADNDRASIGIALLDASGNVLARALFENQSGSINKSFGSASVPAIPGAVTARVFGVIRRGTGAENNGGIDNIRMFAFINKTAVTPTTVTEETASYALTDNDLNGRVVKVLDSATAISVTVPSGLTAGETVTVIQKGLGQVTFVAGGGVTIYAADNNLKLRTQFSSASLVPSGVPNTYYLVGDLSA